jgi:S-(hydroxymethyl)glutathione dehydrogenase / alcohol dehydrogenase
VTRAAVLFGAGQPLEICDVEVQPPKDHEITVRLAASGVCHSDLTAQNGTISSFPTPIVLGHEGAGVVIGTGKDVTAFAPGDHVVLASAPKCGQCFWCRRGQPTLCETIMHLASGGLLDDTPRFALDGAPVHQLCFTGTFSEVTVVPDIAAVKIPDDVPLGPASLLGCGVVTGYGAAVNTAGIQPGDSVVVIGCGGVGLSAIQGAKAKAAGQIIAIDRVTDKLDRARRFGATHAIGADEPDLVRQVRRLTERRGADVVIDATGSIAAMETMIGMTRRGGECVFVGMPAADATISLPVLRALIASQRTFRGCVYGAIDIQTDVPGMIAKYQRGELLLDEMVTRTLPLEEVNSALKNLTEGVDMARSVIVF